MAEDFATGSPVPNGIARDAVEVTPSDTQDNVPSNSIGFVIYFTGGSEPGGTVSVITDAGSTVTLPFIGSQWNYFLLKRIRATDFPAQAVALALLV